MESLSNKNAVSLLRTMGQCWREICMCPTTIMRLLLWKLAQSINRCNPAQCYILQILIAHHHYAITIVTKNINFWAYTRSVSSLPIMKMPKHYDIFEKYVFSNICGKFGLFLLSTLLQAIKNYTIRKVIQIHEKMRCYMPMFGEGLILLKNSH